MLPRQGKSLIALVLPLAAGTASIAFSWLRWIDPFVDSGHELDVPARLAAGERLYRDVNCNYGPAAPWLNALALRCWGHRFATLEVVGLLLSIAILGLLFWLTVRAGSFLSAVVATTLTAAICLGAPWGGAFIFPYAFANLYSLAGSLLAVLCFGREPARGRDLVLAALGLVLSMTARPELGIATALILLLAGLRSRDWRRGGRNSLLVAGGAGVASLAIYAAAFAGIPWQTLRREVPFLHLGSLPPEWSQLYRSASGLLHPIIALRFVGLGAVAGALLLALFAWAWPGVPVGGDEAPEARRRIWIVAEVFLVLAGVVAWQMVGGGNDLPPLLSPLPVLAPLAAAFLFVRKPLAGVDRDRFLLFSLATVLASRVLLKFNLGPNMGPFTALAVPCLVATAAVLGLDMLAPRLAAAASFRRRLAVLLLLLGGLFLYQLHDVDADGRIVRIETRAGALRLRAQRATAITGVLDYLARNTSPGDSIVSFPEGGFFNFITGLRNPLRETLLLPGVLDDAGENEILNQLDREKPKLVLLCNRPTNEFGTRPFGKGYASHLWAEVEKRYLQVAAFRAPPRGLGRPGNWFVRVYERIGAPWPPLRIEWPAMRANLLTWDRCRAGVCAAGPSSVFFAKSGVRPETPGPYHDCEARSLGDKTMGKNASWVHGNAVTVESPENLAREGHYGWGGDMLVHPGKASWFHIPLPTPVIVNDARSSLQRVFILFKSESGSIRNVHVYDGSSKPQEFNDLLLQGEHRLSLDAENTFVLEKPHTVVWGIGISFYFVADIGIDSSIPAARLIVGAAGGDFLA